MNLLQVFVRDFVPSGLARLMKNDPDGQSVKTFLLQTPRLQGWGTAIDDFTPVRAEPVDSALWWIVLLRSYIEGTGDRTFKENLEVQKALKLILHRYLSVSFDTFPTLLCADGCCMIDSRMVRIHGYPIEIQALFYFALRCARGLLEQELHAKELLEQIDKRLTDLRFHIQNYYWLDVAQLNNIYRHKTKEYSSTAAGKFNVVPDSIPAWVFDFMPLRGGWFLVGNCIAILSSLATPEQATAIMDLIEEHWEVLIGEMPLKIAYPVLEGHEWRVITGSDPKNMAWSYHNGGSWPTRLWLFTAACIKASRLEMAKRAIEQVEQRMSKDNWPEYYDGKVGRYVGMEARKLVPRTVAGYLVAKLMMENPATLHVVSLQN
ncbi:PREDICTED: probable alkaline/neutral invertase [Prunus dulcis]|uniref:Alkaline/neutral invertase n=2 Tax=Prunus dulcis TaxID=3755 RepID=A0A5E4ERP3_PRUDU|nr:PREDICTED: probable alkaline/neutral invertase [Prunus dulcis]